jgi:hypothetical protein
VKKLGEVKEEEKEAKNRKEMNALAWRLSPKW